MIGSSRYHHDHDLADALWDSDDHVPSAPSWWRRHGTWWGLSAIAAPAMVAIVLLSGGAAPDDPAAPATATLADGPRSSVITAPASPAEATQPSGATGDRGWARLDDSYQSPLLVPAGSGPFVAPDSSVTGDLDGLNPELHLALQQLAGKLGTPIDVISGLRNRREQETLYQRFLAGFGNLAAVPGTSRHETGDAADVYVDGTALANIPGARAAAAALGLGFPVPGEAWHIELLARSHRAQ